MSYILEVQEDENGDSFILLPDEITEELGCEECDILEWNLKGNGIVLSRLNDIDGYEVLED